MKKIGREGGDLGKEGQKKAWLNALIYIFTMLFGQS